MSTSRSLRLVLVVVLIAAVGWIGWNVWSGGTPQSLGGGGRGGTLRATYQTEPTNFIRFAGDPTAANLLVSTLTQATLVRANAQGEVEPRLASRWSASPDGLTWTIDLNRDAAFSDGTPVTSADVVFSVRAALASAANAELKVGGQPIAVRAVDDYRLEMRLPAPHGPGISVLELLPILPRHKLEAALDGGLLPKIWAASVAPSEVVGAGPFVLTEYQPGQRLRFERNRHFFGRDDAGVALPYLDAIELSIVPEYNTELLRLQAGETDVITDRVNPEDIAALRQAESAGAVRLVDAGPTLDVSTFWFNLRPGATAAAGRPWLVAPEFRRAISHAVNRQAIVDTVFLGQGVPAYGPVTSGHAGWYVPDLPVTEFDQTRARTLLSSIGLTDRTGDGMLEDAGGRPVRFSVITRSGQPDREKTVAVVQEQLRQVGIAMDIVTLAQPELVGRYTAGDFDAIYFGVRSTMRDPIGSMGFWLSSGQFHFWNPGQTTPATEWEARIDALMQQQAATVDLAERRRLFAEAQRILADELPALWFVAPRATVAVSGRVQGATPVIFFPPVLWNAERLSLSDGGR